MNAKVEVVFGNGRRHRGVLTDEYMGCRDGSTVVVVRDLVCLPDDVDLVRVYGNCPLQLFDAAVESGFYVIWMPGRIRRAE